MWIGCPKIEVSREFLRFFEVAGIHGVEYEALDAEDASRCIEERIKADPIAVGGAKSDLDGD